MPKPQTFLIHKNFLPTFFLAIGYHNVLTHELSAVPPEMFGEHDNERSLVTAILKIKQDVRIIGSDRIGRKFGTGVLNHNYVTKPLVLNNIV